MLKIPVRYLSIHIHLLIPINFFGEDQILLCCIVVKGHHPSERRFALRPMILLKLHIHLLIPRNFIV